MAEVLVLDDETVGRLLQLPDLLPVLERGFCDHASRRALAFPVVREQIPEHEGIFGIKSGYASHLNLLGFKAGGFWKLNPRQRLSSHQSVVVLFHPQTGLPRAVVAANTITLLRTGAVGAIAARFLARRNARRVAVIGSGAQGRMQLTALRLVRPVEEARCFDVVPEAAEEFAARMSREGVRTVAAREPEAAIVGADVVVTATPSYAAIVQDAWVVPGMHITAVGADTKGKQEIDPRIFARAKVVLDDLGQCRELGEAQHAFRLGLLSEATCHAELGEVVAGTKPGRTTDEEITVFDATGVVFEDLMTADLAVQRAQQAGLGKVVSV